MSQAHSFFQGLSKFSLYFVHLDFIFHRYTWKNFVIIRKCSIRNVPTIPGNSTALCAQLLSHAWLLATPWTVAHQAPLSMGFPRQQYWSGLPFPSSGDLPDPGIEPTSPASPALAGRFFTTEPNSAEKDIKAPNNLKSLHVALFQFRLPIYSFNQDIWTVPGEGNGNPLHFAWRVPWTEEPGLGSRRVGHDWATQGALINTSYVSGTALAAGTSNEKRPCSPRGTDTKQVSETAAAGGKSSDNRMISHVYFSS